MKIIAKGREAVLEHLEQSARSRTDKPAAYILIGDDAGTVETAIIAGHTFAGSHKLSNNPVMDGMIAENGIIIDTPES